jgi:predicted Ser/Thr protein kinase
MGFEPFQNMIEAGKVLQNRYRIEKQIGQGGMGAVYIATDERFGSTVAIKETLFMDDNYRKAIEREARLLNSLKHTALPRVSDHFLEENGQFLVMEYIPGEDLFDMMEGRKEPFHVDDILNWADQLLDALDFLHNQDMPVIHRDIKPQNLKLTARGQIILLDFGLAKGNPTDAEHQTAAKSIFGYSRNYASLEQIQGTGTDPRSDLYSLAATLYHLLTGTPPEDALTRAMGVLSQKPDPLLPAHRVNPEVPKGVAMVLHQAMDLNAASRPGSASAMRSLLRDCDKTIVAGEADTVITPFDADLLAQETRVMGGDTVQEGNRSTDVKTAILPAYDPEETAIRAVPGQAGNAAPAPFMTKAEGPRGRKGMAVAAALLLAVSACAAGLYLYNPSLFGATTSGQKAPVTADVSNATRNANVGGTNAAVVLVPVDEGKTDSGSTANTGAEEKTHETAKNPKTVIGVGKSRADENPDEEILTDGEEIRIGNVKIREGRVETPDKVIDEDGVHPKFPNRRVQIDPNFRPLISPEDMQKLTPAQRKKIRLMMRNLPKPPNPPREREDPDDQ